MSIRISRVLLLGSSALLSLSCAVRDASAQSSDVPLPQVTVTAPSPIVRRAPAPRVAVPAAPARSAPAAPPAPAELAPAPPGTLPIITDQFATVTVVPKEEIRRNGGSTLGDLLFSKPGITGSSFAPGASSRPVIRGLDVNRVRIQENGIGANGASDLGEDHFVPVDPLTTDQVEVMRGPATLRFGSQAIGGVVETTNNRIPESLPCHDNTAVSSYALGGLYKAPRIVNQRPCVSFETRTALTTVDNGLNGAGLLDAGANHFAVHIDAFGRSADDYRVPRYPYLVPPDPTGAPNATQPGAFHGRQPNSSLRTNGESLGGSYIFNEGFVGVAVTQNDALYHIPGIDGEDHQTRIDAQQTKVITKGEWRTPTSFIDAVRFWGGATDYKHNELGLGDPTDPTTDGVHQTFTNKEQEFRTEVQLAPFNLRFASLTTAIGAQAGHQELTAPSPDNAGLWDPNSNHRVAGFTFNELKFSETTKAQIAGRIESVDLTGFARTFPAGGGTVSTPTSVSYTPKSASVGLIQNFAWGLVGSVTAQYVERAAKPAELFSGGPHDATATFDKGNTNLQIEAAKSIEAGVRRAAGPFRFELTGYYTKFNGFIYRALTGNTCDGDTAVCGPGIGGLNEALYSQKDAIFRGFEFQNQWDLLPVWNGMFGIEDQADLIRATFTDGTNVPRIPPVRVGGGFFWRNDNWLARVNLLHAFAQDDIAPVGETPTPDYNDLRAEISYRWKSVKRTHDGLSEMVVGIAGHNLLNDAIRNSVSYSKDEVLMPGAGVRAFATVKY